MEPEDKTITHQHEVEALFVEKREVETLYADEAVAHFKRVFFPADPSEESVLVDAANLDVLDLVAIFRAAKNLEPGKHSPFVNTLILPRSAANLTPLVRVNPQFVDRRRQQKIKVCELLHEFFYGDCASFATKWQEIVDMGDAQLLKFLQQAEEALGLPETELKVIKVKE